MVLPKPQFKKLISSTVVQLFAKAPEIGRVKTRLMAEIGAEKALAVYLYCLEHNLSLLQQSGMPYEIWLDQQSDHELLKLTKPKWQKGNNLGEKMHYAMNKALSDTNPMINQVILIGSDCLDITPALLQSVAQQLEQHPLVLIPALDGGYVLIAARQSIDTQIFQQVDWGTDKVLDQTLKNCRSIGLTPYLFNPLRDIDHVKDMQHYAVFKQFL